MWPWHGEVEQASRHRIVPSTCSCRPWAGVVSVNVVEN